MYHSLLLTSLSALPLLFPTTILANPTPHKGMAFLRRALNEARQTDKYEDVIPYKVDPKWLVWNTHGDGPVNKAIVAGYEYMKKDYPEYKWSAEYADDEGLYAYDGDALDDYEKTIWGIYEVVNEHAKYDGEYKWDYEKEIDDQKDHYCAWWWGEDGPCWLNALIKWGEEIYGEEEGDPYRKEKRKAEDDWAVYATSVDLNKDYAKVLWDFYVAINDYGGGMEWEYEWEEIPDKD